MSRRSEWHEVAADAYLDARYRNWTLAEEAGDVLFVPARRVVLVHRERAEHVAAALGAGAKVAPLELVVAVRPPAPVCPPRPRAAARPEVQAQVVSSRLRAALGWLGILAGAAVYVAALVVPLDDPALVMALAIGLRGGRLVLAVDS